MITENRAHNFKDLSGTRKGRLNIKSLDTVRSTKKGLYYWCECACGVVKSIHGSNLRPKGKVVSCGCYREARAKQPRAALRTRSNPKHRAQTEVFCSYRKRAERRGMEFTINREQFVGLAESACRYCGIGPSNRINSIKYMKSHKYIRKWVYNGLDRKDSLRGYTPDNVVPCCIRCNKAKLTMTVQEFGEWITLVSSCMETWYEAK